MAGAAYGDDLFENIASSLAVDYNIQAALGNKKTAKSITRGPMQADRPVATYTSAANIKR
jgi:hypothetical protein